MALGTREFISRWLQGAFDLRRRCRPGRYLLIAPAGSALPQTKIPPAIRKFLSAFGITDLGRGSQALKSRKGRCIICSSIKARELEFGVLEAWEFENGQMAELLGRLRKLAERMDLLIWESPKQ
ncbi:hypothetical protein Cflav_PD1636 [Pedosphaera parvula Ellin514]|uniref:Uncharacterized protein n=1 Tax=Pedosphaera parvula (strain Ellin514) TaxID=320771 RepID=B9XM16_PEDPL|nr:hypothetical protein Cflav_PD1636 [Pedosphaera parvula Ellin514]